jgi:hypothetical protein
MTLDPPKPEHNDFENTRTASEGPRPLYRTPSKSQPYPMDALGPILAPVARAIAEITQASDAICANAVLAAASLAVQAHADVRMPGSGTAKPATLFILTIAESGERKTTADTLALKGVRFREAEIKQRESEEALDYRNHLDVYEKERAIILNSKTSDKRKALADLGHAPIRPARPILVCTEPTVEGLIKLMAESPPTLGLFSSEGGSFIGGHAMNDEARLRTAARLNSIWDGTPIDRVRAGDGSSVINGKRVALHLMAQPEAASRFLADRTLRDIGLTGRLLMSAPAPKAGTRLYREASSEAHALVNRFAERIAELLRHAPPLPEDGQHRTIELSAEARDIFVAGHDKIETAMLPGGELAPVKPFASKMAEHAARIAAVIALVEDPKASEISADAMRCGFALADYHAGEAVRLAGEVLVSENLRVAERLRLWLLKRGQSVVHLADIYQFGPTELRDKATALAAMKILEDHGHVIACPMETVVDGKRRKQAWKVVELAGDAFAQFDATDPVAA